LTPRRAAARLLPGVAKNKPEAVMDPLKIARRASERQVRYATWVPARPLEGLRLMEEVGSTAS
jgi:hypothetical protein